MYTIVATVVLTEQPYIVLVLAVLLCSQVVAFSASIAFPFREPSRTVRVLFPVHTFRLLP